MYKKSVQVSEQVKKTVSPRKVELLIGILKLSLIPQTRSSLLAYLGLSKHPKNYKNNILIIVENGLLELTVPDKPNSKNQKYRTTEKGRKILEIIERV